MLGFIISMFIIGVIAGFIARAVVPGRDAMGFGATVLLGVVGSFVGGFLTYVMFNQDVADGALQPTGVIGSIVGSIIALLVYRAANSRSAMR